MACPGEAEDLGRGPSRASTLLKTGFPTAFRRKSVDGLSAKVRLYIGGVLGGQGLRNVISRRSKNPGFPWARGGTDQPPRRSEVDTSAGALNGSMQHHLTGSRDGGGANGATKSDRVEPAAASGTVGPVEGRGVIKRYRTSPRQSSLGNPQVAGLTRWDCPAGATAIGKIIIDGGARGHFPWPLNWAIGSKDSSGFGPRTLHGEPGSDASRRSPSVSRSSGGSPRLGSSSTTEALCLASQLCTAAGRSE